MADPNAEAARAKEKANLQEAQAAADRGDLQQSQRQLQEKNIDFVKRTQALRDALEFAETTEMSLYEFKELVQVIYEFLGGVNIFPRPPSEPPSSAS